MATWDKSTSIRLIVVFSFMLTSVGATETKCNEIMKFMLFLESEAIYVVPENLTSEGIVGKPLKIVIHGLNDGPWNTDLSDIRTQYINNHGANVIVVDWEEMAKDPFYIRAYANTRIVGYCIAKIVEVAVYSGVSNIHAIGFSLGAQVCNFIATHLKNYKLNRITGLDPALPGFLGHKSFRLDKSDAVFVDVFHTNMFLQGTFLRSGHIDFIFNGGSLQPGCSSLNCHHSRAMKYYHESLTNNTLGFYGVPCSSLCEAMRQKCNGSDLVIAGDETPVDSNGLYMVQTLSKAPFARGRTAELMETYRSSNPDFITLLKKTKLNGFYEPTPSSDIWR